MPLLRLTARRTAAQAERALPRLGERLLTFAERELKAIAAALRWLQSRKRERDEGKVGTGELGGGEHREAIVDDMPPRRADLVGDFVAEDDRRALESRLSEAEEGRITTRPSIYG